VFVRQSLPVWQSEDETARLGPDSSDGFRGVSQSLCCLGLLPLRTGAGFRQNWAMSGVAHLGYWLRTGRPGVRSSEERGMFLFATAVPDQLSEIRRTKREADFLPSSGKASNTWCFNSAPPCVFVVWCLSSETVLTSLPEESSDLHACRVLLPDHINLNISV
jgi:hypothetical protein